MKKIINKREIAKKGTKYLIKWKKYKLKWDLWKNILKINNVMKLIKNYKNIMIKTVLSRYLKNLLLRLITQVLN